MPSPRRALLNLLVFLLLAVWYIFTRDVYPQKAGRAVILGRPSVSLSVCCSLGEERGCGCWPLAQTGVELLAQLPLWLRQQHSCNITSPLMWQEKKNCWLLLFHFNLCFEGCTFRKYEFKFSKIKLSTWHLHLQCLQTEVWSQAEYPILITKVITTGHYRQGNITFWYIRIADWKIYVNMSKSHVPTAVNWKQVLHKKMVPFFQSVSPISQFWLNFSLFATILLLLHVSTYFLQNQISKFFPDTLFGTNNTLPSFVHIKKSDLKKMCKKKA